MAEWQTRTFEGRVSNIVWVQVPSLAPRDQYLKYSSPYFESTLFNRESNMNAPDIGPNVRPSWAEEDRCGIEDTHLFDE